LCDVAREASGEHNCGNRRPLCKIASEASDFAQRPSLSDVFIWYNITPIGVSPAENMGGVKERSD